MRYMVAKNVIDILQREGVMPKRAMPKLRDFQKTRFGNVLDFVRQENFVSSEVLFPLLRDSYHIPIIDLNAEEIDLTVTRVLPRELCYEHGVVPFRMDDATVSLAMVDPDNDEIITFVRAHLKRRVIAYLAERSAIMTVLATAFDQSVEDSREQIQKLITRAEQFTGNPEAMAMEMPVVALLNHLIAYALRSDASDLHIEPGDESVALRFRIDGLLHDAFVLPTGLLAPIIARIKILSHVRIDEHLRPQDGRFTFSEGGENVAIRVSIIPTLYGPKAALRFLDADSAKLTIGTIGMSDTHLATVRNVVGNSYGLIIVTGPTGSGKTTTLYALLNELRQRQMNLSTIEDPIEYHIPGVNQMQTNTLVGLTFSEGLRSILRQDPDIIMVGEIRDRETAQIAVNAALTGHLVLTSLHTNSASGAIPRLIDMGIEPYLISSTVRAVIGQRLVRRVCGSCKTELSKNVIPEAYRQLPLTAVRGTGCSECLETGYRGRTGIYEVMTVDAGLHDAIMSRAAAETIEAKARANGMRTMREHGIEKISTHETSFEEVIRTTQ